MDSCFTELPDYILSSCLRLTSFVAKLRCQQVCTSWRSLLKRSAAPGDACEASKSSLWGRSLRFYVSEPTKTSARTRIVDLGYKKEITFVDLITTAGPLSLHNEACLHWIGQQAMVYPEVCIDVRAVLPAQLILHLATALKVASAMAPSEWQLQLDGGTETRTTNLQLSNADNTASLQTISNLLMCPNLDSQYTTIMQIMTSQILRTAVNSLQGYSSIGKQA